MNNSNPIFSKENQKLLKERYKKSLEAIYKKDSSMITWCEKQVYLLVPICGGKYILPIEKISISKEFYFGYSDIGQGRSFEENSKLMENVSDNIISYFVNSNLSATDTSIEDLNNILNNTGYKGIYHNSHYYSESDIHSFSFYNKYYDKPKLSDGKIPEDLSIEDVSSLLDGYNIFREYMFNRLMSYIKKHGTKHISISSYWVDR